MGRNKANFLYKSVDAALRSALRVLPVTRLGEKLALLWGYRYGPEPRTIQLRSGLNFEYSKPDFIPLWLYYFGTFEPSALSYAKRASHGGQAVMDVGANLGFYSVELANVVHGGRLIAVEAIPEHAASVRRNAALNGFGHIEVVQAAVGAQAGGFVRLELPKNGNSGMYSVASNSHDGGIEAPLTTIDDIVKQCRLDSLDFIKMDIEGSELAALQGAEDTLRRFNPTILVELNEPALSRFGASTSQVKSFLDQLGYIGWKITRRGTERISVGDDHYCDECIFVHRSKQGAMKLLALE
jgi:FkbM family methyltransferase